MIKHGSDAGNRIVWTASAEPEGDRGPVSLIFKL